ncbi:MAG: UDP-N-acetylmuramoyl-L-alanine--D-glutamate ligase [Anaerolineales bacterium]|nr:UDP-N-acetylmuramoyl-L-alanine--D-glutamate ligase [Anaerolineales bacterium]
MVESSLKSAGRAARQEWRGRQVVIIGAARQGTALAAYLVRQGARVVLNDQRPVESLGEARGALSDLPVTWVCGGHPLSLLDGADLVCVSGGVPLDIPLILEAQKRGLPLSNDSQIFMEAAPCRLVGITGSAGKTTTTSLVGRIAQDAVQAPLHSSGYRKVWVGGNIGSPLISHLEEMAEGDLAVVELSSFQLELVSVSPRIAAILNITPNHLDRHGSMAAYTAAKARILLGQESSDVAVLGWSDPGAWSLSAQVRGRLVGFGLSAARQVDGTFLQGEELVYREGESVHPILPRRAVRLRGEHNLLNVLAACSIAWVAGLPVEAMRSAVESFTGVPHRLEFIREWRGARWYNDSIATAPERAIAALRSFDEPIILLAGGRDKDLPWEDFVSEAGRRVRHLVLFGEAGEMIAGHFRRASQQARLPITRCAGLQEAVKVAADLARPGDVVLLSPGGTSFDEFRDFEERGEKFCQWVLNL